MGRGPVAGCGSAVVMGGGFGVEAASSVGRWIWVGVAMVGARGLRLDLEGFLRAELEGGTVWSHWSWDGGVEVWRGGDGVGVVWLGVPKRWGRCLSSWRRWSSSMGVADGSEVGVCCCNALRAAAVVRPGFGAFSFPLRVGGVGVGVV